MAGSNRAFFFFFLIGSEKSLHHRAPLWEDPTEKCPLLSERRLLPVIRRNAWPCSLPPFSLSARIPGDCKFAYALLHRKFCSVSAPVPKLHLQTCTQSWYGQFTEQSGSHRHPLNVIHSAIIHCAASSFQAEHS